MSAIAVFETITENNFSPERYVKAHPEVLASGLAPRRHYEEFGRAQDYKQVTTSFMDQDRRRARFDRFRPVLDISDTVESLPVTCGDRQFDLADYAGESSRDAFAGFVADMEAHPDRLYLDLGCGLRKTLYDNCIYLEVYPSLIADLIVAPDRPYPVKSGTLDGIACFAVLEHVRQPWKVVEEMHRMLKPGGKVWIGWPFLVPIHGFPSHYFNATREGLRTIFEDLGFETHSIATLSHETPDYTMQWVFGKFVEDLPEVQRQRVLAMTVGELLSHKSGDAFWTDLLASISEKTRSEFANGNTLVAEKR
jgi:SAM-dependent methyltransferase